MTSFSSAAWARTLPLYEAIRDMPFNRDLATGALPAEAFRHYIIQDAHYLIAYGQALAATAAKADEPSHIVQFAKAAEGAILVERSLHAGYFETFGIGPADLAASPPSPACHHYASFLLATAFREPFDVALAALLPCFWIYAEVGLHIHAAAAADNPYRAWIDAYAGEDFHAAVRGVVETTDAVAARQSAATHEAMHAAYRRAAQLEWMFWDSASRLERWPV